MPTVFTYTKKQDLRHTSTMQLKPKEDNEACVDIFMYALYMHVCMYVCIIITICIILLYDTQYVCMYVCSCLSECTCVLYVCVSQ